MPDASLPANSLAECYLYLKVTPCSICRSGATEPGEPVVDHAGRDVRITVSCGNCGGSVQYRFTTDAVNSPVDPLSAPGPINTTSKPSQLIDIAQWVTLHGLLREMANASPDRQEARWLAHRAAQCLDEALRFYPDGEELPPADAFYADSSRQAFREHPERFARERLLAMRGRLPAVGVEERVFSRVSSKGRPWWKFWTSK